jgi:hypothetical protein
MSFRQKAHGTSSATFAVPTLAGNTIVALVALEGGGTPTVTDDKGNDYLSLGSTYGFSSARSTDILFTDSPIPATGGVTVVTNASYGAGNFIWIFEIDCSVVTASPNFLTPNDVWGKVHDQGPSSSLVGPSLVDIGTDFNPPTTTNDFCLAIAGADSETISAVDSPWTLDTVQGNYAVAYRDAAIGPSPVPTFTASGSTTYCVSSLYVASGVSAPPGPGNIIVHKATSPSGSPGTFVFRPSWGPPFTLIDGGSHDSGPLVAGSYHVTETPFTGWDITTSQDPTAIVVTDGTTVNITFTNTVSAVTGGGGGGFTGGETVQPWLVSIEDHLLTINDLDGDADLADMIFNVQDRLPPGGTTGLITADFPTFVFEGKRMRVLAGFDGMDRTDFVTLFTGTVDAIESANGNMEYVFTCPDVRQELTRTIYTVGDDGFPTDSNHPRTLNGHPLDILLNALTNEVGIAAVDIAKIEQYRDTVYNGVQFEFKITSPPVAKDFIANELMKPLGAYIWPNNLGEITVNFYYPLSIIPVTDFNRDNLIEIPESGPADLINEVSIRLDYDSSDSPLTEIVREDAASVAKFGLYGNHIIESKGLRSGLQGIFLGALTAWLIFLRYGFKQLMFGSSNSGNGNANPINALWSQCLVEPGDIATMTHPQVPDRNAGVMGVVGKTFTVMDRQWQFFPCLVQLKLLETDLSPFKQYLIAPNGEPVYTSAPVTDQDTLMFLAGDDDQYLNGNPGNTLS